MPVGGAMQIVDDDMKQLSQDHPQLRDLHKVIKEAKITFKVRHKKLFLK